MVARSRARRSVRRPNLPPLLFQALLSALRTAWAVLVPVAAGASFSSATLAAAATATAGVAAHRLGAAAGKAHREKADTLRAGVWLLALAVVAVREGRG
jgi:hypothetical protein